MSEKMLCPVCNSYTSTVLSRIAEGGSCPYCSAPAELVLEVNRLKARNADEALVAKLSEMGVKIGKLEAENRKLREFLSSVQTAVDYAGKRLEDEPDDAGDWS